MRIITSILVLLILLSNISTFALERKQNYIVDPALRYSAKGMTVYGRNFEAMMQNSVNSNTPGYKEMGVANFSYDDKLSNVVYYKFVEGVGIQSGGSLDFLIQGPGFFVLKFDWGEAYTRDGRFTLDRFGTLVTVGSNIPVMGENGEIHLARGKITISQDGIIYLNGNPVDTFKLVAFTDVSKLQSINGSIFFFPDKKDEKYIEPDTVSYIQQGYYEASNVSITSQVSQLPVVKNMYDANTKAVKIILKSLSSGIQIGQPQ